MANKVITKNGDIITGTADADLITSNGYYDSVVVNAGAGDDTIGAVKYSGRISGAHVQINGQEGNDLIYSESNYATINGGSGNDSIYSSGYMSTIIAGTGDDFVSLNGSQ